MSLVVMFGYQMKKFINQDHVVQENYQAIWAVPRTHQQHIVGWRPTTLSTCSICHGPLTKMR
jgi:hypothetical protein